MLRLPELRILVVRAQDFVMMDFGRWYQFLPWLVGRPEVKVSVTFVGTSILREDETSSQPVVHDDAQLATLLSSRAAPLLRPVPSGRIVQRQFEQWWRDEGATAQFDLGVVFTPAAAYSYDELLSDDGVPALVAAGLSVALFSTSETDQLVDERLFLVAGISTREPAWPNPWALQLDKAEQASAFARMGWGVHGLREDTPSGAERQARLGAFARHLLSLLETAEPDLLNRGIDSVLTLGETLHSREGALYRLPQGFAVDVSTGQVFEVEGSQATESELTQRVPQEALSRHPGVDDLLERALWAAEVFRDYVRPAAP